MDIIIILLWENNSVVLRSGTEIIPHAIGCILALIRKFLYKNANSFTGGILTVKVSQVQERID